MFIIQANKFCQPSVQNWKSLNVLSLIKPWLLITANYVCKPIKTAMNVTAQINRAERRERRNVVNKWGNSAVFAHFVKGIYAVWKKKCFDIHGWNCTQLAAVLVEVFPNACASVFARSFFHRRKVLILDQFRVSDAVWPARWVTSNINFAFDVTAGKKNSIRTYIFSICSKFCYSPSAADFIQELTGTPSCMQTLIWRNVARFVYKSFDIYLRWIVEVGGEIAPGWFFVLQQCVFIPSHLHRMQKMGHFRATRRQWNVQHYLNWRGLPGKWKNSLSFSMRSNCLSVTVHRKVEKHGECGGPNANLFDLTPRCLLNFQRFPCGIYKLSPAPPRPTAGICPPCQSRGWGICKVCTAWGPGIYQPQGHSQAFDLPAVSYQNITTQKVLLKKKQIGSSVKDRNKLKRVVKACSQFYACISSLLIKQEFIHSENRSYRCDQHFLVIESNFRWYYLKNLLSYL